MGTLDTAIDRADTRAANHVIGMSTASEQALFDARRDLIESIVDAVRNSKYPMSDFVENNYEFADQVHAIFCSPEETYEQWALIRDAHDAAISKFAEWMADNFTQRVTLAYRNKLGM